MKKEMVIVIILLIIVLILSYILQRYTSNSIKKTDDKLNDLAIITEKLINEKDIKDEEIEKMKKELKELEEEWNKTNNWMSFYLEHDELEKVNNLMVTIKKNIEIKDYEELSRDISECIFVLNHINDKVSLKLTNLF